jgi:hypothetical protein
MPIFPLKKSISWKGYSIRRQQVGIVTGDNPSEKKSLSRDYRPAPRTSFTPPPLGTYVRRYKGRAAPISSKYQHEAHNFTALAFIYLSLTLPSTLGHRSFSLYASLNMYHTTYLMLHSGSTIEHRVGVLVRYGRISTSWSHCNYFDCTYVM